jgi:hypothetical protein
LVKASREGALRQAGRQVVFRDDEDEEGNELDRRIGAQAELPPGVIQWPPRVFLARERTYAMAWHKWLLRQGEASRPEGDPRMAAGDTLSVLVHWLDYWSLCWRLAIAAEDRGGMEDALALWKMSAAYADAAYKAARMRVDAITLDQISKPVAEMYTRSNRIELQTVTVMPSGIRMLREFNKATVTARTKAAANKAANVQTSRTVTDSVPSEKNRKRSTGKKKEEPRKDASGPKRPAGAPQAAAEAGPAGGCSAAAGGQCLSHLDGRLPYGWDRCEPRGGGGSWGRIPGSWSVSDMESTASQGGRSFQAVGHPLRRGGFGGDGGGDQEASRGQDLAGDDPSGGEEVPVHVPGVHCSGFGRQSQVGCRPESSLRILRSCHYKVRRSGRVCGFADARRHHDFNGFEEWLPPHASPPRHQAVLLGIRDDGRRDREVLPVYRPTIRVEPEWLLVCPNRLSFLDVRQGRLGIPRAVVHRQLSDLSFAWTEIDRGGLHQSVQDPRGLLARYGLNRHPGKGVWGRGSQVVMHLGFVVDTKRGRFGVSARKLENIAERARKLRAQTRANRRRVTGKELETFLGKAQSVALAAPDTAFRLRALYTSLPKREGPLSPIVAQEGQMAPPNSASRRGNHSWSPLNQYRRCTRAVLSHPALRDLQYWRNLSRSLHHRPMWTGVSAPAAMVHTDAPLTPYGATLAHGEHSAGSRGHYKVQGYCDGQHREKTHITIHGLTTVRLSLRQFVGSVRSVRSCRVKRVKVMILLECYSSKAERVMYY